MKAITVKQPWASLIAAGVKTIITRPRPTDYRGRIRIHAAKTEPPLRTGERVGDWRYYPADGASAPERVRQPARLLNRTGLADKRIALPLGAVVASATLTDCVPIETPDSEISRASKMLWTSGAGDLKLAQFVERGPLDADEHPWITEADLDDQLPYGDFRPGWWALLLDDIAPTTTRCPACWDSRLEDGIVPCQLHNGGPMDEACFACWNGELCPLCHGALICGPVPATGHPNIWDWNPT